MRVESLFTIERYFREVYLPNARLKQTTRDNYEVHLRKTLRVIGSKRMIAVRKSTIEHLISQLQADGHSVSAIGESIKILSTMWTYGIAKKHFRTNPCVGMRPPRQKPKIEIYKKNELEKMLNYTKHLDPDLHLPTLIAINTGARRGEVLGLQWEDVDLREGTLNINKSYIQPLLGEPYLDTPKTPASVRIISIPESLVDHLRSMQRPTGFVVTKNSSPFKPSSLSTMYGVMIRNLGIHGRRFHDLRHTHASILIAQGVDIVTVSHRLGHTSPAFTLSTYAHLVDGMDAAALQKFETYLNV